MFKGFGAIKTFYNASSELGDELYLTGAQIAAIQSAIQEEVHQDRRELHKLREVDVPHEASVRRLLQTEIAVLQARLTYPTDDVLDQLDQMLNARESLSRTAKHHVLTRLHARLAELQAGG